MIKTFKLFSNCILVKGAKRQIICDLQKNTFYFIPLDLFNYLSDSTSISENEVYDGNEKIQLINDYSNYLISNELGFYCTNPESFPDLEVKWDYPGHISNSIIELKSDSNYNLLELFAQLEELGCQFLEIRFYDVIDLKHFQEIIELTNDSKFLNLDVLMRYNPLISIDEIEKLINQFGRIGRLLIFDVPKTLKFINNSRASKISVTELFFKDNQCCGQVSVEYFVSNIEMYMESKLYNNCLNRKISINSNGEIKNCPSTKGNFGNIKKVKLRNVINNEKFKTYWNINKDQISVCKDCEFRYICPDCRAFREDPDDIYSKPLKCGYNPYTTEWESWSTNPLKQKGKEYYKFND